MVPSFLTRSSGSPKFPLQRGQTLQTRLDDREDLMNAQLYDHRLDGVVGSEAEHDALLIRRGPKYAYFRDLSDDEFIYSDFKRIKDPSDQLTDTARNQDLIRAFETRNLVRVEDASDSNDSKSSLSATSGSDMDDNLFICVQYQGVLIPTSKDVITALLFRFMRAKTMDFKEFTNINLVQYIDTESFVRANVQGQDKYVEGIQELEQRNGMKIREDQGGENTTQNIKRARLLSSETAVTLKNKRMRSSGTESERAKASPESLGTTAFSDSDALRMTSKHNSPPFSLRRGKVRASETREDPLEEENNRLVEREDESSSFKERVSATFRSVTSRLTPPSKYKDSGKNINTGLTQPVTNRISNQEVPGSNTQRYLPSFTPGRRRDLTKGQIKDFDPVMNNHRASLLAKGSLKKTPGRRTVRVRLRSWLALKGHGNQNR